MTELPKLTSGNVVLYASDDDLRASAEGFLTKGALAVVAEVDLEPLAVVTVTLQAPRLLEPLALRCEVVGLQPQRSLLRVLEPAPESFAFLTTLPVVEGMEPAVEDEDSPLAVVVPDAPVVAPEPPVATEASLDHDGAVPSGDVARSDVPDNAPPDTDAPSSDGPSSDVLLADGFPCLPPHLSGEVLRFATESDFNAAGKDLYLLGAVMATCDHAPSPGERRTVKLQVETRLARSTVRMVLSLGAGGMVVVQLEHKEELSRVLPEVLPPKALPARVTADEIMDAEHTSDDEDSRSRASVALRLPPEGPLRNPTTADALLSLHVMSPLSEDDLALPSTHLLLRWLLTTKGIFRIDIEQAGHPAYPFLVVDGREVRAAVAMPSLGRSLVEPTGRYTAAPLQRAPRMTHSGTVLQLMQEVVSGYVGKLSDEELERGLLARGDRCPVLNDVGVRLLDGLSFPSSHKRLALKALTGKQRVYDVTQHAVGARSAFEVLYTLEVSGALNWVDAEGAAREERQRKEKERLERLVEGAAGFWEKIAKANHFEAMGLHWSTPPRKIQPAFEELERLYGPKGEARPEAPEVCDRIWRKVTEAYAVLSEQKRRRAHRKEAYSLKWSAQIDVFLDRADIAMYRKDLMDALDLLLVCQDIQPTTEAADRLVKLQEAQANAKAQGKRRDMTIDDLGLDPD